MAGLEVSPDRLAERRPVSPRVADREKLRVSTPVEPPVVIPPADNPLRGWRRLTAVPLVDATWRRGIESNPVACYYAGRSHGGLGELTMATLPFLLVLGFFGYVMLELPLLREGVWAMTLILAISMIPVSLVMGVLLMGWSLRRHLTKLSIEQLLVTRVKPPDILRGLAIRPMCRLSGILMVMGLALPALMACAVYRSGLEFSGEWVLLGAIAYTFMMFGSLVAAQFGGAVSMRAHIYIRRSSTAMIRAFVDIFVCGLGVGIIVLVVAWFCGIIALVASIMTGNSITGFLGLSSFGGAGFMELVFMVLIVGSVSAVVLAGLVYAVYHLFFGIIAAMQSAEEFTYLYPEEWWITNPGRSSDEDTYQFWTPWDAPYSPSMQALKSRVSGTRKKECAG